MTIKFTKNHEWAKYEGDLISVGITNYAQEQLGDVVFVELPDINQLVRKGEVHAVVESVKAAGEVKSPVSGLVIEVNNKLKDFPEKVNEDPTGDGWFYKIKADSETDEFDSLLDRDAYQALIDSLIQVVD